MAKICVTSSGPTLESVDDPRFGRCAYFIIADPETLDFEDISNDAAMASGGAGVRAAQTVAAQNVEAVGVYIYEGYNKGSHIISNISR